MSEAPGYNDLVRSIRNAKDFDNYTHQYFAPHSADKYSALVLIELDQKPHRGNNPDYWSFLTRTLHLAAEVGLDKLDGHREWYDRHECGRDLLDPRVILGMGNSLASLSFELEGCREEAFQSLDALGRRLTAKDKLKIQMTPFSSRLGQSRILHLLDLDRKHFPRLSHKRRLPICPPDQEFRQKIMDIEFDPIRDIDHTGEEEFRAKRLPFIITALSEICDDPEALFFNSYEKWSA